GVHADGALPLREPDATGRSRWGNAVRPLDRPAHDRALVDQLPPRPHPRGHRQGDSGRSDGDEIAKLCADLAAAGLIEPTTWPRGAEAGTDPSWGRPKRAGKAPCGVSGTGAQANGLDYGREGLQTDLSALRNSIPRAIGGRTVTPNQ